MLKKTLLVGNGINITNERNQRWDELIKELFSRCAPDYTFIDTKINCLSNIDKYELLFKNSIKSREEIREITDGLLKSIEKEPNKSFIQESFKMYDEILTTNYDLSFEQVAYENCGYTDPCRNDSNYLPKSIEKRNSLRRYANVSINKNGDKKQIWHIHGAYSIKEYKNSSKVSESYESICFDRELYCSNLDVLMRSFHSRSNDPLYFNSPANMEQGSSIDFENWGHFFYFRDMDIIGLGMSRDELDLWWMLSYRALSKRDPDFHINNKIRYFCIDERKLAENLKLDESSQKKKEEAFLARMELFESLDVETVIIDPNKINDICEPYKNPEYYMYCLKIAK